MLPAESTRLRILFVGMRPPRLPIRDGYVLHLHHLLVEAHKRHNARFLAPSDGAGPFEDIGGLSTFLVSRSRTRFIHQITEHVAEYHPDLVHVVGAPLAGVIRALPPELPTVLGVLDAPHLNIEAIEARGPIATLRKQVRHARAISTIRRSYGAAQRVVVVSAEDGAAIERERPGLPISVIPNGVDFEAFDNRPHLPRQSDHLMFTGALDYAPNIAAARFLAQEVLPKIRERHPSARLSIVGRDPAVEVTDLDKRPGVSVVGPVDDMGDALSTASIYLCPMISGTGIKNKLLEALANGLPCVASELAVRGTRLKHGAELLIANTPDEIADASVRLLSDERLREELSEAGRRFVIANHTWMSVADQYSRIYREVIATADA